MLGPISVPLTIPDGATGLSGVVSPNNRQLVGLVPPAAWTAATLEFQWSPDGTTFYNVSDKAGAAIALTDANVQASLGEAIMFDAVLRDIFRDIRHLKLRSGTAASPVDQNADRAFTLIFAPPDY